METLLVTVIGFAVVILIMSVGIIFKRKPIKGTCGGISALMGDGFCDICEHKSECFEELKLADQCEVHDCHKKDGPV